MHGQGPLPDGRRDPCMNMELNAMECLEAYGVVKGSQVCMKFLEDHRECKVARIRMMRLYIMRMERQKKLIKGDIKWADRWGKPYEWDSYVPGSFMP